MREHDTLAKRLGMILTRLNTGERLNLSELTNEFNVTERTLQRDFNERLNYLPIEREGATYYLDPSYLGRGKHINIKAILMKLGLARLFPAFNQLAFNQVSDQEHSPFLFRDMKVEDISAYQECFKALTFAIQKRQLIQFIYKSQAYAEVEPYKLVNDRGSWYLAAIHHQRLKTFKLTNIQQVKTFDDLFELDTSINQQLEQESMLWLTERPIEVILKVDAAIASHFNTKSLLPEQQLIKQLEDGCLLLSANINHKQQIIPILKYWLPEIEILSPLELKQSLVHELQFSIDQLSR